LKKKTNGNNKKGSQSPFDNFFGGGGFGGFDHDDLFGGGFGG